MFRADICTGLDVISRSTRQPHTSILCPGSRASCATVGGRGWTSETKARHITFHFPHFPSALGRASNLRLLRSCSSSYSTSSTTTSTSAPSPPPRRIPPSRDRALGFPPNVLASFLAFQNSPANRLLATHPPSSLLRERRPPTSILPSRDTISFGLGCLLPLISQTSFGIFYTATPTRKRKRPRKAPARLDGCL